MEKGAWIERGTVINADNGQYTVKSLDREGIVTPPMGAVNDADTYQADDMVYFFLFRDGTGRILCRA